MRTLLLLLLSATPLLAQTNLPKGSLVLTGGEFGPNVIQRFVELAGGPEAQFVYIPTAASSLKLPSGFIYDPPDNDVPAANTKAFEEELARFFGVRRVTVLHTRNRATANSEKFIEPLKTANGVWLSSGNAGRLADAYLDTLTQKAIENVWRRGGVVGGNSAGSIIQGSYIVRGRPDKPLLMAKGHERGFGFLNQVAVNPHLTEAKRETELVNVVDSYPSLLGIGIDEKAAIVVQQNRFLVIGEGRVAIYDNQKHGGNWYYWLFNGDSFDLGTRMVMHAERTISGTVYFTNNTPRDLSSFPIQVYLSDHREPVAQSTIQTGNFQIAGLRPGRYLLRLTWPKVCVLTYRVDLTNESRAGIRVIMDAACAHHNGQITDLLDN